MMQVPDIKVHGANMEPIWGQQDPGWPHVRPMNFAIWVAHHPLCKAMTFLFNIVKIMIIIYLTTQGARITTTIHGVDLVIMEYFAIKKRMRHM